MKNILYAIIFCLPFSSAYSQTTSVYHVESEYTPQNGYRYYFDKIDPQTGMSTRLSQLPVDGFFSGYAFFNCFGHYVFQGIDTVTFNGNYINKLYELDTLGNLIRTIPMDTATGTWYKMCWPSSGTSYYYALRLNTQNGQWVLETINAINGSRVVMTLPTLSNYSFNSSDAAITRSDIIWMGMDNPMIAGTVLLSVNPVNGTITYADTVYNSNYYDCLSYDCANDTVYGFIAHMDSVQGAELIKIHGASGTVIHTGRTAIGGGFFVAGTHTRMADGQFYVKTSSPSYLLPDMYVGGPTFTMPFVMGSPLPVFCFAAPRESCSFYTSCTEPNGLPDAPPVDLAVIFPNPVTDGLLNISQEGNFTVRLIDIHGREIYMSVGSNSLVVPVSNFANGTYFIRIESELEVKVNRVLIKN